MTTERSQRKADNRMAHALARAATRPSVPPREIPDDERIFTSEEEELLPEEMCDGHVARRGYGRLTREACVNRICDLMARGTTETEARQYIGVSVTEWGRWRQRDECGMLQKMEFATQLYHSAVADECVKILKSLRAERRAAISRFHEEMRKYRAELTAWHAKPSEKRGPAPLEPYYDGPTDLDLRMDTAMVTHLQWKLEKRAPEYAPKNVNLNLTQNVDQMSPEQAAEEYYRTLDLRPNAPSE